MVASERRSWRDAALLTPAAALFLFLAGGGIHAGLFPDEMMNIHGYWIEPWTKLLQQNILFFTGGYRPAGALFYRPLFDLFGFNPLPYRLVCFAFLLGNLTLVYALARRLTSSDTVAGLAAVLFSYNAYCSDLYYSSGTFYDLMCFACFCGAIMLNAMWRDHGRLSSLRILSLVALQIAALNAKEMAVTLPLMIAAYEFLFHNKGRRDFRACGIMLVAVAAAMWGRLVGFGHMADNPAYRPSIEQVKHVTSVYLGQLLYQTPEAGALTVAIFALVVVASLVFGRAAHVRFAAFFSLVTPLPVLLIQQRSLYAMYIPMFGFAMLAASLIGTTIPERLRNSWVGILLPVVCALVLLPSHLYHREAGTKWLASDEPKVRSITSELRTKLPALKKGATVYFRQDPFPDDDWLLTFIFRLYYRDDTIAVNRAKRSDPGPDDHAVVLSLTENPWLLEVVRR